MNIGNMQQPTKEEDQPYHKSSPGIVDPEILQNTLEAFAEKLDLFETTLGYRLQDNIEFIDRLNVVENNIKTLRSLLAKSLLIKAESLIEFSRKC